MKTSTEIKELIKQEEQKIKDSELEILKLKSFLKNAIDFEHYGDKLVNLNKEKTISVYEFKRMLYKSLTKKYKKQELDIHTKIQKELSFDSSEFKTLGKFTFQVNNSCSVYNIKTLIDQKPDLHFLRLGFDKHWKIPAEHTDYSKDKKQFYQKLEKLYLASCD
jgi:hypothetical protein